MTILVRVAWVIGALLAVVLAVVAVGWALPVSHRAVRRATYAASPAELYALVTDVERFPQWRSRVTRVEVMPSVAAAMRFREIGADGTITYDVEEAVTDARVVTRIADRSLPFGGRWVYTLRPTERGTELEIVEEGEVYNPIFRFVSRFVMGHTASIDRYLDDVALRFEHVP